MADQGLIEERDLLAWENKMFAEYLDTVGFTLEEIGEIARLGKNYKVPSAIRPIYVENDYLEKVRRGEK